MADGKLRLPPIHYFQKPPEPTSPRVFVGFSSTDIHYYRLMQAWKKNENIEFNFTDCQLRKEINSSDEKYIKRKCRERIMMAGRYAMLIGEDTWFKYKYVQWEAEVAIEKNCTIIGINLNGSKGADDLCPAVIDGVGAIFVPFSRKIINFAIKNHAMTGKKMNYRFTEQFYNDPDYYIERI